MYGKYVTGSESRNKADCQAFWCKYTVGLLATELSFGPNYCITNNGVN